MSQENVETIRRCDAFAGRAYKTRIPTAARALDFEGRVGILTAASRRNSLRDGRL
jgi:hypothetical protein